ncbi:MAG TPA: putative toxin-antitoxin system toxin component, PIN family [Oxalicibacterium sp.]|uniref:putative toxin-antitoxin system toxin component, PIN family n=1 Tax=Oxalicibacterium sp. TaxID=2766525 RepID=UPI002CB58435|nr:putative toxin-antitoxin system toxin component, PIN family [Oxalicibacterium sp.]HWU97815.1 putative toxin-antitoxin system toxin component, PIN family [Oxalicibacterium sp.]
MIPKRVVLDTNVCLDLFVFRDPRWGLLHDALKNGCLEAITRDDCRKEWSIVLHYPHLKLDDAARMVCMAEFDSLIRSHSVPDAMEEIQKLPICKDKDDQKFLEIARDARVDVLITKDKALLKLARKTRRDGLFAIMTPEAWTMEATALPQVAE